MDSITKDQKLKTPSTIGALVLVPKPITQFISKLLMTLEGD